MVQSAIIQGKIFKNLLVPVFVAVIVVLFVLLTNIHETVGGNQPQLHQDSLVFELTASYPNASKLIQNDIFLPVVFKDYPGDSLELGEPCTYDRQCASGFCNAQDSVCCDKSCDSTCEACVASKTGGSDGFCSYILAGTDPDDECPGGECDGFGSCQEP